jgi:hypothetical protein
MGKAEYNAQLKDVESGKANEQKRQHALLGHQGEIAQQIREDEQAHEMALTKLKAAKDGDGNDLKALTGRYETLYDGALKQQELAEKAYSDVLDANKYNTNGDTSKLDQANKARQAAAKRVQQIEKHIAEVDFEVAFKQVGGPVIEDFKKLYHHAARPEHVTATLGKVRDIASQQGIDLGIDLNQQYTPEQVQDLLKQVFDMYYGGGKAGLADYTLTR